MELARVDLDPIAITVDLDPRAVELVLEGRLAELPDGLTSTLRGLRQHGLQRAEKLEAECA